MKKGNEQRGSKRKEKEKAQPTIRRHYRENTESSLMSAETYDEFEIERKKAYTERSTQNLLRSLLEKGKEGEIVPSYDPTSGFIYKTVESVFEEKISHEKTIELLERLTQLDILMRSFFDTVSTCPQCESTTATLHYRCPKCKSHNIVKTNLTEHIPCGLIAEREKFTYGKCPRCGGLLAHNQYRDMGRWYICRECNEKFEHPQLEIICRRCDRKFTIEESRVLEISKYTLNKMRKNEIRQNVTSLESIRKVLKDLNFQVEIPGIAIGQKSGMQHRFSILATKEIHGQEIVIAVDHAVGQSEVYSPPLILYLHKTSEIKVDIPIFIAIPKLNETAKKIAQGYQLLLIEGLPESQAAIDQIRGEIELRLTHKTSSLQQKTPTSTDEKQEEGNRNSKQYKSNIKPQLFSTTSSIHQPQKLAKARKSKRFIDNIKKTIRGNKKTP